MIYVPSFSVLAPIPERPRMFPAAIPTILNCFSLYLSRYVIGTPMIPLQYLSDDNSRINFFVLYCESVSVFWIALQVSVDSDNLELTLIVSVDKRNRHTEDSAAISRFFLMFFQSLLLFFRGILARVRVVLRAVLYALLV